MNEVLVDRRGPITIATLNRPDRHNAMNSALLNALTDTVSEFGKDDAQRVLIITGAGEKAFCSGGDLGVMHGDISTSSFLSPQPDQAGVAACEKPIISAINGIAVGGGMEIAICSDIRIASEKAWFGLPEASHGFIAGIAAVRLARTIPLGIAMDMMLTGERLTAADALRLGFVQKVVAPEMLIEEAMKKAEKIAKASQPAIMGSKALLRYWGDQALGEHQRYYEAITHRVLLAGDVAEGLDAFSEKRAAVFGNGWANPFKKK